MKKHKAKSIAPAPENIANDFLRGMFSTALLVGIQQPRSGISVLARSLQGGFALASAAAAANALQQGRPSRAAGALALGTAGILGTEFALRHHSRKGNE